VKDDSNPNSLNTWLEPILKRPDSPVEPDRIAALDWRIAQGAPAIRHLGEIPDSLMPEDIAAEIQALSVVPNAARYDSEGRELAPGFWQDLLHNCNVDRLTAEGAAPTRFGLVTRRSDLRTFPTTTPVHKQPGQTDLDRLQETIATPGEGAAILRTSRDGAWHFVRTHNYAGWMPAAALAIAPDRQAVLDYLKASPFLTITARQTATVFNPVRPDVSELALDMGVRLPLIENPPEAIDRQSTAGNHVVLLPTARGRDLLLQTQPAILSAHAEAVAGHLPLTRANILRQAFKCLGERYGWGGMHNARDCSSLIQDIFRCFGLRLPRNAGDQAHLPDDAGRIWRLPPQADTHARLRLLDEVPPGACLYLPGHVMMFLGMREGHPYVIHDFYEYCLPPEKHGDSLRRVWANQVMVTPLSLLRESGQSLLEAIDVIRDFAT